MRAILRQLEALAEGDLYALSEAVDEELQRRNDFINDMPDSARRRASQRGEGRYRRSTGAAAPPVRHVGLRPQFDRRAA